MPDERSCFTCRYLCLQYESVEMPEVRWYECRKRPQNENLKNFPFTQTQCAFWVGGRKPSFNEVVSHPEINQNQRPRSNNITTKVPGLPDVEEGEDEQ